MSLMSFHMSRRAVLLAVLSALLLAGCGKEGDGDLPIIEAADVDVQFGLQGDQDLSRWTSVRILAANRGADFNGTVSITGGQGSPGYPRDFLADRVTYRLETEIPGGSTREVALPVRPEEWTKIRVEFRQPGFSRRFVRDLPEPREQFRVLAVSEQRLGFGWLSKWLNEEFLDPLQAASRSLESHEPVPVPRGAQTPPVVAADPARLSRVVSLRPSALSGLPVAYEPYHMVLLHGTTLSGVDPGVLQALRRWVEGGGVLVSFPGSGWGTGLPEELLSLLGVTPGEPNAVAPAHLTRSAGEAGGETYYRELLPRPGAEVIRGGLAIEKRLGAGSVTTFSMGPLESGQGGLAFPAASTAPGIYDALSTPVLRALWPARAMKKNLLELERSLPPTLFQMSGFLIPSRSSVALGLLCYLVIGFFVPALVFKRLRRREWTFLVVLLAAALATGAIYFFGLLSAREELELEEITILRVHRDGQFAEATSFLGLISPRLQRVSILPEAVDPSGPLAENLPSPLRGEVWTSYRNREDVRAARSSIDVDLSGRLRMSPLLLHPNGMRYLRYDYRIPLKDILQVRYETLKGGLPVVPIVKNLGNSPMDAHVLRGDRRTSERIGPGEELRLGFDADRHEEIGRQGRHWGESSPPKEVLRTALHQAIAFPGLRAVQPNPFYYYSRVDDQSVRRAHENGILKRLRDEQPDYFVALFEGSRFPAADAFRTRKGLTALVLELPGRFDQMRKER